MSDTIQQRAKAAAMGFLTASLARFWFATIRVSIVNRKVYDLHFRQTGRPHHVVGASWHRHAIFLFYFFRNLGDRLIMISRSRDGEITANIARQFGYTAVRGSSSKGGRQALEQMIDTMNAGSKKYLCGTAVDGPRGPARVLKKGMVAVARQTGALFVPMACSGNRMITFPRAWDKTIIPKPFSRMTIIFGEPVAIPTDLSDPEIETIRQQLEDQLNLLTDEVDRICGYRTVRR
ncbi:lysophospholipid acyltransferase family protein [uncultured Desulfosarcina sp.]|uniref:lysophospholipid acyltransferase family protein n=1 Tax=uncultured Desulfosarcina sp. TaxID=218289 RepID=UPI0029C950F2|nr:lysophospholipid acyltransferase family protein [uncultured Desulfosarcina sp.]